MLKVRYVTWIFSGQAQNISETYTIAIGRSPVRRDIRVTNKMQHEFSVVK